MAEAAEEKDGLQALKSAFQVLQIEAEALMSLAAALDESFVAAVEKIEETRGRVVVSGMGKSGHVARKIAATLASTGTPAYFVHHAEASHGDLGMITPQDTALVLSNSGETPELGAIIGHVRRNRIPLLAIASNSRSSLMRAADIALTLPDAPEACKMGLAPTTSTTMTMALGDALAVALMERRKFLPEHFRMLHPGGTLGAQLLKTEDLMHTGDELPLVHRDMPMQDVVPYMTGKSFGIAGVVDNEGRLLGAISDGDLRRNMQILSNLTAFEAMSTSPKTTRPGAMAQEALRLMNEHQVTCLFVLPNTDERPVAPLGLLHIHDCLRAGIR